MTAHAMKGDMDKIKWYAHYIKGSSANIGAIALSTVAADMEQACKDQQAAEISVLMPQFEEQYELLMALLREA